MIMSIVPCIMKAYAIVTRHQFSRHSVIWFGYKVGIAMMMLQTVPMTRRAMSFQLYGHKLHGVLKLQTVNSEAHFALSIANIVRRCRLCLACVMGCWYLSAHSR